MQNHIQQKKAWTCCGPSHAKCLSKHPRRVPPCWRRTFLSPYYSRKDDPHKPPFPTHLQFTAVASCGNQFNDENHVKKQLLIFFDTFSILLISVEFFWYLLTKPTHSTLMHSAGERPATQIRGHRGGHRSANAMPMESNRCQWKTLYQKLTHSWPWFEPQSMQCQESKPSILYFKFSRSDILFKTCRHGRSHQMISYIF